MGRVNVVAQALEPTRQSFTTALNAPRIAPHPGQIRQRGARRNQAQSVQIVRVLHFHHASDNFLRGKGEADAHAGQGE